MNHASDTDGPFYRQVYVVFGYFSSTPLRPNVRETVFNFSQEPGSRVDSTLSAELYIEN